MAYVQYMVLYIVKNMGLILRDPIFYILAIAVCYLYKREIKKIQKVINEKTYTLQILKNIIVGTLVGIAISGILAYHHIQFYFTNEVLVLIPIAIGLMLIHPKLGCFSYVLTVGYLIQGVLALFELPTYQLQYEHLIILVGALHLIEGLLVIIDGDKLSIQMPLYEDKQLKVGHLFRQIWMVPLLFVSEGKLFPLYTILAYGDLTTKSKKQKYITGILILSYGSTIGIMGYSVIKGYMPLGASIILMPVLHEFIFILSHPELLNSCRDHR